MIHLAALDALRDGSVGNLSAATTRYQTLMRFSVVVSERTDTFVYSTVRTPFGLRSLAAVPLVRVSRNLRELLYLAALIDRDRWGAQRHDNTRTLDLFVRKVDALDALAARGCRA